MSQYDTYAEELQDHSNAPRLCPDLYNTTDYQFCAWAKTVTGFDANAGQFVAVAVTCKRWGCPWCATAKIRRLAWMSRNAEPNRLLTLTISDKRFETPVDGWNAMSKAFPELIRWIRKNRGDCDYLRVLELQANGTPHFHCMLRAPFVPHAQLYAEWKRLIGAPPRPDDIPDAPKAWAGVNIKRIDSSFRTFNYLVKYLTKLHKIPWTDRHVSYSRGFFLEEDREEVEYAKLDEIEKHEQHPWVWLQERYGNVEQVAVLGHGKWLIGEVREPYREIDPTQIGLPGEPQEEPEPPKAQRLVPGIEEPGGRYGDEADSYKTGKRKRTPRPKLPGGADRVPF